MRIAGNWARYGDAERAANAHVANLEYLGEFGEGEAGGTKRCVQLHDALGRTAAMHLRRIRPCRSCKHLGEMGERARKNAEGCSVPLCGKL